MRLLNWILVVFLSFAVQMQAQQKSIINSGDERKIAVADKKIAKGDAIVDKKEKYTRQIEAIDAEGKSRSGKVRRLQSKSNKIIVSSASFYKEGYGKKYKTYKKAVNKGVSKNALQQHTLDLMHKAGKDYKRGRKLRRKLNNLSDANRAAAMLLEANEVEARAVETLIKAAVNYKPIEIASESTTALIQESEVGSADTLAMAPEPVILKEVPPTLSMAGVAEMDSIAKLDALPNMDSTMVLVAKPDSVLTPTDSILPNKVTEPLLSDATEPAAETKEIAQVYFTVQFVADRKAMARERLTQLYDGPFEVLEHVADGWYRYSFGEFSSVNEAKVMKIRSGVHGFVVAYLNNIRISIKEANEIMKNQEVLNPTNF
ncbi:hypothetical protein SAMN06265379_10170 [Saccharicrinis carchari]|uniref:Sporulation related domain-containing protein n=1 Tax=Saccharicrinis carchari TaxID=1168039 RepID=A0A521AE84_SACCC|nr:hypothetical protein [Saccharicrinis carchari]SMO33123.1 hypothetical protein SAMN06265379_10170 [Saccharicrinis carchari]